MAGGETTVRSRVEQEMKTQPLAKSPRLASPNNRARLTMVVMV